MPSFELSETFLFLGCPLRTAYHVSGISNMEKISDEERKLIIKLSDEAFGEFQRAGKVTTIHCHLCGGLLEIKALSPSAWESNCPCGKYKGTWRGL